MKRAILGIGLAACLGVTTMVFSVARAQVPAGPAQGPTGRGTAALPAPVPVSMPASTPLPAVLRDYAPVTAQRLLKPEPGNWLMIRGTYDGWGYSPLRQITTALGLTQADYNAAQQRHRERLTVLRQGG